MQVTSAIAAYVRDDDEPRRARHEFARNILDHRSRSIGRVQRGFGNFAQRAAHKRPGGGGSLSVYLLDRAGYDLPPPSGWFHSYTAQFLDSPTHPNWHRRIAAEADRPHSLTRAARRIHSGLHCGRLATAPRAISGRQEPALVTSRPIAVSRSLAKTPVSCRSVRHITSSVMLWPCDHPPEAVAVIREIVPNPARSLVFWSSGRCPA